MGKYASHLEIGEPHPTDRSDGLDECLDEIAARFDRFLRLNVSSKRFSARFGRFHAEMRGSPSSTERIVALTRVMLLRYGASHPESAYTEAEIETICKAAVLHDIGKLAIPAQILEKPERLLPEEAAIMRRHTRYGYEIVKRTGKIASSPCARYFYDICLMHHERWDGSGYPSGLCGNAIPLYVQIVSVVDAYDALVTTRFYKPTYSHDAALEMIADGECGVFNPAVVECLAAASDEIRRVSETIRINANDKQRWMYGALKRLTVSFALSISVVMLAIGVTVGVFAGYLNDTVETDRVKRLSQFADSSAYNWVTRIEEAFTDLDYMAERASPADPDHPELQRQFIDNLKPFADAKKFYEFSIFTVGGTLYSSLFDGPGLDGANVYGHSFDTLFAITQKNPRILAACDIYEYVSDGKGGYVRDEAGIPVIKKDENGEPMLRNGFFLTVPVYRERVCVAFLSAAYVSDEVFRSLNFDDFGGKAMAHIFTRRDGNYVGQPEIPAKYDNFYELAARFRYEGGMTTEALSRAIADGKSGFVRYKVQNRLDGRDRDLCGYYRPLELSAWDIDQTTGASAETEWYLFLTVTAGYITSFSDNIQIVSVLFYVFLGLGLILMITLVTLRIMRLMRMTKEVAVQYEGMRKSYELSESKYKAILQQTRHMVFEYDHETGMVSHEEPSTVRYAIPESYRFDSNAPAIAARIHPEDMEGYLEMWHNILGGKERAECTLRLLATDGHWVWNRCIMQNIYDGDMRAVRAIGFAEDVNDILEDTEKLRDTAMRDSFTGAYNKIYTGILVNKMLRGLHKESAGRKDAFLILDLDDFKTVNDTFGHASGDVVLKNFAQMLASYCKGQDLVGRIGGDEFVFYLYDVVDRATAQKTAKRVLDAAKTIGGNRMHITCSIGIVYAPDDGTDFQTLYEIADKKLYQAKRAGGDRWV